MKQFECVEKKYIFTVPKFIDQKTSYNYNNFLNCFIWSYYRVKSF